jgi:uncharacterized protein
MDNLYQCNSKVVKLYTIFITICVTSDKMEFFMKNQSFPCYTGKLFRAATQPYFFNTLAGSIDAVSEDTASMLVAYGNHHRGCDLPRFNLAAEDLRPLIKNPYDKAKIEATLNRKLRLLVLELTRSCNMACTYCIDGEAYAQKDCLGSANMSEDVALRGVDYLLEHSSDQTNPLTISFYGGEPLLRFSLLKKVVEYSNTHAKEKSKHIGFSVTTNGTLLTPDIAKFLINNDVQMLISLDGPKKIHNRYRHYKKGGETFEVVIIALEMVRNLDPEYFDRFVRCSVVVTPGSDLEELKAYFDSLHVNVIVNFVDTYGLDKAKLGPTQEVAGLQRLKMQMVECLAEEGPAFLEKKGINKDFGAALLLPMMKNFMKPGFTSQYMSLGQCILGASRLYLSADHSFYPCEKVSGHSFARIGTIETGIDADKVRNIIGQFYEMAEKKCSGCWMSSRCSACLAIACSGNHLDQKKYSHYCRDVKVWGESILEMAVLAKLNLNNKLFS